MGSWRVRMHGAAQECGEKAACFGWVKRMVLVLNDHRGRISCFGAGPACVNLIGPRLPRCVMFGGAVPIYM